MKRTINSSTGFSPVKKEKKTSSPAMNWTNSQSSLISTSNLVRKELDRALAFEKPSNERSNNGWHLKDWWKCFQRYTFDIIFIIEAKN
jgi:hypothetical protein